MNGNELQPWRMNKKEIQPICLFIPLVIFSLYFQLQNPNDAIAQCNEALKLDENDVDALCDRAEAHILNEMYDEGEIIHSEEAPTLET